MTGRRTMYVVASALLATSTLAQNPFALDTTFRTTIVDQNVNAVHVMQDGKLFASGRIRYQGDLSVSGSARLHTNGDRDLAYTGFFGGERIVPWFNGKFYVSNGLPRRMMLDGSVDPSFIALYNGPYFLSLQGGDYHVYPDGGVLISGKHTLNDPVRGFVGNYNLIWFTNTGYLDTTRIHRKGNGVLNRFKELPNGGFIVSGNCTQFDGVPVDAVFRTDADGIPDTSFHSGINSGAAHAYLSLPDGRVYIGGKYTRSSAQSQTLYLSRLMPDGSLDPTFSIPQFTLGAFPVSFGMVVACVYPWDEGRLIVTGQFQFVNGQPRGSICMLDSTGTVLDAFDACGVGPYVWQSYTYASIECVVRDTVNNYLYVNGAYTGYSDGTINDTGQRFVTRLHVGDFTTGTGAATPTPAFSLYPNPTSGNTTLQLETLPANATLVVRDALCREVQRRRVTDHYTTLTFSRSGMYVVELWDGTSRLAAKRIVVE